MLTRVTSRTATPRDMLLVLAAAALRGVAAYSLHTTASPPPMPSPSTAPCRARHAPPSLLFGSLPPEIQRIATPDWRFKESSCSESELRATWGAFERVYGSRKKALAASRKNQAVILPYLNSAANIVAAHKVLVSLFGREGAAAIIEQNPGVLACDPDSLAKTPPNEIESAARNVAWFDGLSPDVKAGIPFLTWFALVGTVGARVVSCSGGSCGSVDEWDLKGGLAVQLKDAVIAAISGS